MSDKQVTFISTDQLARDVRRSRWNRSGVIADPMRQSAEALTEGARRVAIVKCGCEHCAAALDAAGDGTINHLPGADYHGMERIALTDVRGYWTEREAPTTAPAPKHERALWYRPMARTDLASVRVGAQSDALTPADVMERVQSAVRRLMSSRGYWDQQDAASYMVGRILNTGRRETGSAADVIRYMDRVERFPVTTRERTSIPPSSVTPLALSRLVADWSRREAHAANDSLDAAAEGTPSLSDALNTDARTGDVAPAQQAPAPALPPYAAERACDQLTTALGVGKLGGVWETLYVLIRDITTEDAAPELGTTHAALRAKTSRGAKWLRANLPTPADLRRALDWYTDPTTRERKLPARPLREGTNAGAPAIRPKDADHARALCAGVILPTTEATTTEADRVSALLALR